MNRNWQYQLVIQIPLASIGDFDRLIEAEQRMETALANTSSVTGHDAGTGEGNIFIHTDTPDLDFQKALSCLDEQVRDNAKAAYRKSDGENYTILWPPGLREFHIT